MVDVLAYILAPVLSIYFTFHVHRIRATALILYRYKSIILSNLAKAQRFSFATLEKYENGWLAYMAAHAAMEFFYLSYYNESY